MDGLSLQRIAEGLLISLAGAVIVKFFSELTKKLNSVKSDPEIISLVHSHYVSRSELTLMDKGNDELHARMQSDIACSDSRLDEAERTLQHHSICLTKAYGKLNIELPPKL